MTIDRHITSLAAWLSRRVGFLSTCFIVAIGLGLCVVLSFDAH